MKRKAGTALASDRKRPQKVQRQARMQPRRINGEINYVDSALQTVAINTTGSVALVVTIPQGATQITRVGKRVFLKSIQWRGVLSVDTTTTFTQGAWLLIYDKRPTGALPVIADIFNSASPNSMNNDDNSGRFEILKREDFILVGNSATPSTGMEARNATGYLKMKRRVINYKSVNTGAITDIEEGAIYFVTIGQTAAGTADGNMSVIFRARYTEV